MVRRLLVVALGVGALGGAADARAESKDALGSSHEGQRVDVTLSCPDDLVAPLGQALTEAMAEIGVETRIQRTSSVEPRQVAHPPATATPSSARVWLDGAAPGRLLLYLTTADGSRVYTRTFLVEHGVDAVTLELLRLVTRNSVDALLAGTSVGVSREEYERALATTVTPVPSSNPANANEEPRSEREPYGHGSTSPNTSMPTSGPSVWHLGVHYEWEMLGTTELEQGPVAEFEWESKFLSVGLAGQIRIPFDVGSGPLTVRLVSRTARVFAAYPIRVSNAMSFSAGGALGVDWIDVEPKSADIAAQVQPSFSVADPIARSFFSFRVRSGNLEFGASAALEIGLVNARYFLLESNASQTVFAPWPVRPLGAVSLGARWQ